MPSATDTQRLRKESGANRRRRFFRVSGYVALGALLLLIVLPTLVSYLPTERVVSHFASGSLADGTIEIRGLRTGWLRSTSLRSLSIRDADGRTVIRMDDLRIPRGLLSNLFARDRFGIIRVESLMVSLHHNSAGELAIAGLTNGDDSARNSDRDSETPFNLEQLLSDLAFSGIHQLPIFQAEVGSITIRGEETIPYDLRDGAIFLGWESLDAPIIFDGKGAFVSADGKALWFASSLRTNAWNDGERLTPQRLRVAHRFAFDETDPGQIPFIIADEPTAEVPFLSTELRFQRARIESEVTLTFAALNPALDFFIDDPQQILEGALTLTASVGQTTQTLELYSEVDLSETEIAFDPQTIVSIDPIRGSILLRLTNQTFFPEALQATLRSSFLNVEVSDRGAADPTETSPIDGRVELDFLALSEALRRIPILADLPLLSGEFITELVGERTGTELITLGADLHFAPNRLRVDGGPLGELFVAEAIDLSSLALSASARLTATADSQSFELRGNGQPLTFASSLIHNGNGILSVDSESVFHFAPIMSLLEESLAEPPTLALNGTIEKRSALRWSGDDGLRGEGRFVSELSLDLSPELESGSYADRVLIEWQANAAADLAEWESAFSIRHGLGEYAISASAAANHAIKIELKALTDMVAVGEVAERFLGGPLPLALDGGIHTTLIATQQSEDLWEINHEIASSDGFILIADAFPAPITELGWRGLSSISTGDDPSITLTDHQFHLEEYFSLNLSGVYTSDETKIQQSWDLTASVDFLPFSAWAREVLAEITGWFFESDGTITGRFQVEQFTSHDDSRENRLDIAYTVNSSIDFLAMASEEQTLVFEKIDWRDSGVLRSVGEAPLELSLSGQLVIDRLLQEPSLSIQQLAVPYRFERDGERFSFIFEEAALERVQWMSDPLEIVLPPFQITAGIDRATDGSTRIETDSAILGFAREATTVILPAADGPLFFATGGEFNPTLLKAVDGNGALSEIAQLGDGMIDYRLIFEGPTAVTPNDLADWLSQVRIDGRVATRSPIDVAFPGMIEAGRMGSTVTFIATDGDWRMNFILDGNEFKVLSGQETIETSLRSVLSIQRTARDQFILALEDLSLPGIGFFADGRVFRQNLMKTINAISNQQDLDFDHWFSTGFGGRLRAEIDFGLFPFVSNLYTLEGRVASTLAITNDPLRFLRFQSEMAADQFSAEVPDLARLDKLNGTVVYTTTLQRQGRRLESTQRNRLTTEGFFIDFPPYRIVAGNSRFEFLTMPRLIRTSFLSFPFLGGAFQSNGQIQLERGIPVFSADIAITNFDAVELFPALVNRRLSRRSLDGFGNIRFQLPPNTTIDGVFDSMSLRIDLLNIGSDLLREALRLYDARGANPGIQSAIVSLRFASPAAVTMDLRNGLLGVNVDMVTVTGIRFPIPLVERLNLSNILRPYVGDRFDPLLQLSRQALILILSEDFNTFQQFLTETTP